MGFKICKLKLMFVTKKRNYHKHLGAKWQFDHLLAEIDLYQHFRCSEIEI